MFAREQVFTLTRRQMTANTGATCLTLNKNFCFNTKDNIVFGRSASTKMNATTWRAIAVCLQPNSIADVERADLGTLKFLSYWRAEQMRWYGFCRTHDNFRFISPRLFRTARCAESDGGGKDILFQNTTPRVHSSRISSCLGDLQGEMKQRVTTLLNYRTIFIYSVAKTD